jgi:hypothetical protein
VVSTQSTTRYATNVFFFFFFFFISILKMFKDQNETYRTGSLTYSGTVT